MDFKLKIHSMNMTFNMHINEKYDLVFCITFFVLLFIKCILDILTYNLLLLLFFFVANFIYFCEHLYGKFEIICIFYRVNDN